ncbi:hypothetical protein CP960_03655 [Malaciobacter halophilus]|uniref:DUF465 domain-containing protein n=1 Tax=Malaciobacter halophilus TaxID=197482 RepID=A0A2N1J4T2_9BACT|nr:DUF465 domain-containing protein [Malaciobacter halophilus]AXH10222.1 DUF465 domain-containing protein [Malaciobacter halophilus]PKI81563.1 hypothetical protein CP960_03655 [Malaciobacter halophilus]
MFHEHRDIITKLKQENARFHKIFDRHNELDEEIIELEKNFAEQAEIEKKKKEKLKLKDEVYSLIMEYKNSQ